MNFPFDTRIFLLICCLLQGMAGLRMVKVSIPPYKLRGESAFLECQYELNGVRGSSSHPSYPYNGIASNNNRGNRGSDLHYQDIDSGGDGGDELAVHRRMRAHQKFATQRGGGHNQGKVVSHPERQYQHQFQTLPSPYGHSVYRGSSMYNHGGRSGSSTHSGRPHDREDSFADSAEEETGFGPAEGGDDEHEDRDGDSEALYAIKWYKDNEEFYRYVPKANPPKTSYRFEGVRVSEEHSDSSRVLLRGLTLNSTGVYRCEVSAEAPNFSSVQGEGRMDVVYLPRDGPHIKGQQFQYQIGEILNLNCTSGKSHPASHLQWFINEQPVIEPRYLIHYNDTVHKHGLITSMLGLQLTVDARHFHNGAMRVKCLASISPVLWKGGKESVLQRRPGIIDNREAMLLVRSGSTSNGISGGLTALSAALLFRMLILRELT